MLRPLTALLQRRRGCAQRLGWSASEILRSSLVGRAFGRVANLARRAVRTGHRWLRGQRVCVALTSSTHAAKSTLLAAFYRLPAQNPLLGCQSQLEESEKRRVVGFWQATKPARFRRSTGSSATTTRSQRGRRSRWDGRRRSCATTPPCRKSHGPSPRALPRL